MMEIKDLIFIFLHISDMWFAGSPAPQREYDESDGYFSAIGSCESREAEKHKLHILSKSNIQDPKD